MMRPNRVTEQDLERQQICAIKMQRLKRASVIAGVIVVGVAGQTAHAASTAAARRPARAAASTTRHPRAAAGVTTTLTSITAQPNPDQIYEPLRIFATVLPTPSGGTISFKDVTGPPLLPTCTNIPVGPSGEASCVTLYKQVGYYQVVANYSGNATFGPSQSINYRITIGIGTGVEFWRVQHRRFAITIPRSCVRRGARLPIGITHAGTRSHVDFWVDGRRAEPRLQLRHGAGRTRIKLAHNFKAGLHKLTLGVRHLHRHRLTFAVC
jgi:hypothetical protein